MTIDYERGLATLRDATYDAIVATLIAELPAVWRDRYEQMCRGPVDILLVDAGGFTYLFDYASGLTPPAAREDRVVAAFGRSQATDAERPASRLAGFPGSDARGDRGHFMAHASGGGVDINLFHQSAAFNRGWSAQGREYRTMERYCAQHPGTFCFARPIYTDDTARPAELEFGVLKADRTLWVRMFENG